MDKLRIENYVWSKFLLLSVFSAALTFVLLYQLSSARDLSLSSVESREQSRAFFNPASSELSPNSTPDLTPQPIPTSKTLSGGEHVFQTFNNCGPASMSMVLTQMGIAATQKKLGNQLRPYQIPSGNNDDKSVTLQEMAQLAAEYDLVAYHRPAGDVKLIEQFIAHDIPVITRTWLKPGEDIGHYRVVRGYNRADQTLVQDDSLQGKELTYSYDEFEELWRAFNYEFLVLVKPEQQATAEQILGELFVEQSAWQKAELRAEQNLTNSPDDIYTQFNLLVAHYHQEDYQAAVDIYEQIENDLPSRMLWYQIEPILAYYQLGQHDRVLAMTQDIFDSQNRAFSELHYLRGLIYESRSQQAAANEEFELADRYNSSSYWQANLVEISGAQ